MAARIHTCMVGQQVGSPERLRSRLMRSLTIPERIDHQQRRSRSVSWDGQKNMT